MKQVLIATAFCIQCVYGDLPFEEYFSYVQKLEQPHGSHAQGEKRQVPLRDPFLTFALLQAELRGCI